MFCSSASADAYVSGVRMSSVAAVIQTRQNQYEATIINFLAQENGHIITLSDDQPFLTMLRMLLLKRFNLGNALTMTTSEAQLASAIQNRAKDDVGVLVFMERFMNGHAQDHLVRKFKESYPGLRIIILTNDIKREQLMLLHEIGADNCVAKPVSINTLVEKMAFTIKPQSKFGQLIDAAKTHLINNEPEAALELSRRVLEIKPNSAAGYMLRGDAYRLMGDLEIARESYEKASEYAELFLEPLRRLGEMHGATGDTEGHLHCLERMDQISPLNVERKVDMGELHLTLGHAEAAQALFDTAVQIAKEEISRITSRIAALYMDKDPPLAEKYLRRSLAAKGKDLSREDLNTFNQLGINLRQQGRWKDALAEYEKALRIAPDDEHLYYNMGMANAEGRNFPAARADMERALELNRSLPMESPGIAYNIGLVFMNAGSRKEAERHLRAALHLDPGFELARSALERMGREDT
jgi:tetratricopeptide (TPR) repeat protein